jgi:hypothetical protein
MRSATTGTVAFALATAAVAWAAAFTWWALTASVYSDGQTILEANPEAVVRVALAAPLAVSAVAWLALHVACHRASRSAYALGLVLATVLTLFALVAGFSIGLAVLPGAAALLVAAILVEPGR